MVSIIIPIYKSEKYLRKCIDSVIHQAFRDIEILLILDGFEGNEKCKSICDEFAVQDPRVSVFQNENEGVDKARFWGLKLAKGEFITFVDSDDWLENDALSVMMSRMSEAKYDYVEIKSRRKIGPIIKSIQFPVTGKIETPLLFDKFFLSFFGVNILPVSIWGKLYRKDILDRANLKPSGYSMGEDLVFNLHLFPFLSSIYIEDYIGYNYRYGGMTSNYNKHLLLDSKRQFIEKIKMIERYDYRKAEDCVRIEMMNILKSDIVQRIEFLHLSDNEIINQINEEISLPFWDKVITISNKEYFNNSFHRALLERQAEQLYSICNSFVKKNRVKKVILNSCAKMFF